MPPVSNTAPQTARTLRPDAPLVAATTTNARNDGTVRDTFGGGQPAALRSNLRNAPLPSGEGDTKSLYTKEEFLTEMKDKKLSVADGIQNMEIQRADVNGDGVVAGDKEMGLLWGELDRIEKAKTGPGAVELEPKVQQALDQMRTADEATAKKPSIAPRTREQLGYALDGGEMHMDKASSAAGQKDYLGRVFSRNAQQVDMTAGAGKGVTVIHDPKLGFFMKGETGAAVPMTNEEIKAFKKALVANHPERNDRGPYDGANDSYKRLYMNVTGDKNITVESPT